MENKIKWGILGLGNIAHAFVEDLKFLTEAEVVAVGSRSDERATAFAQQYNIPNSYGCYEGVVQDPKVDVIYIATPHPSHEECAMLSLKAGKAVLCEKPFTVHAKETDELITCARENKIFLMEAMWSRFLPAIVKVREWLAKGVIGEIRQFKADFGFRCDWKPEGRLLNPKLAGGALLDVGVYPISFASMILGGRPARILSLAHLGITGVDEQFSAVFGYKAGKMALLSGAIRTETPKDAWIIGTEGVIHVPNFWRADSATLWLQGKQAEHYEMPLEGTGKSYEAAEVMRCLRAGKLESDIMPLDESLGIMKTMDIMRNQWGLLYPFERKVARFSFLE